MKRHSRSEAEKEESVKNKKQKLRIARDDSDSGSEIRSTSTTASSLEKNPTAIKNFRVSEEVLKALHRHGIETFFPIQLKAFDAVYDGKHVIGRARTGTGKTLAFSLPSIESLAEQGAFTKKGVRHNRCRMLVLLPTRELAQQVAAEIELLECDNRFKVTSVVGGLPEGPQLHSLREKGNVVVGTPGRILDFLDRKLLDLSKVKVVVLDEADQMLEMGFRDDVDNILAHVVDDKNDPNHEGLGASVQVLLFTATLPSWVDAVADRYMLGRERVVIDVVKGETNQTACGIRHLAVMCNFHQRARVLGDLLQLYAGSNGKCIVFTETKSQANQLAVDSSVSHICQVLHGDIQQKQREITLKAFKESRFRCLVATDVAARGIHINEIELVIQMDPPKDVDTFVHRSGRTGRAGASGTSLVFFTIHDSPFLTAIEQKTGIKFERVGIPQPGELIKAAAERFLSNVVSQKDNSRYIDKVRPLAQKMVEDFGPVEAVSQLLCELSRPAKTDRETMALSTLTGRDGYKTYEMVFNNTGINYKGYVWKALKNALEDQSELVEKLASMTLRADQKGCVFDVPPEILDKWEKAVERLHRNRHTNTSFTIGPVSELPELCDPLQNSHNPAGHISTKNPRAIGRYGSRGGSRDYSNSRSYANNNGYGRSGFSTSRGRGTGNKRSGGFRRHLG